jgi:hypothetical protein
MNNFVPIVRSFDCADFDPISEWVFDDPLEVDFWLNISVGAKGMDGTSDFQVHVVTEKLISQIHDKNHLLTLPYYSWDQTLAKINKTLASCVDVSWEGMFKQVAKHYSWEYEWSNRQWHITHMSLRAVNEKR